MRILIRTPEARTYAAALLVVASLSCGPLAAMLASRTRRATRIGFLPAYVLVLGVVAAMDLLVLDVPPAGTRAPLLKWVSLPLGVGGGVGAFVVSDRLRRRLARHRSRAVGGTARGLGPRPPGPAPPARSTSGREGLAGGTGALGLVCAVAVLEEVMYRGVLVGLALGLESAVGVGLGVAGATLAFSLAHVELGPFEAIAIVPLSAVCLVAALATMALFGSIAAHVTFNVLAWRSMRAPRPSAARAPAS